MAESEGRQEIIVVRRYEEEEHHHSNSTWKVAHADFMTAMMAFFLIMWLLNATDEKSRQEIANYFNPIKLTDNQPNRKGLMDPVEAAADSGEKAGSDDPRQRANAGLRFDGPHPMTLGPASGEARATPQDWTVTGEMEQRVFRDPYAALAELAAVAEAAERTITSADVMIGASGPAGGGTEVVRDPFDPVYWQTSVPTTAATAAKTTGETPAAGAALAPMSADGAVDATLAPVDVTAATELPPAAAAAVDGSPATAAAAEELAGELAEALRASGQTPRLEVVGTSEGVLISLTDNADFSMFPIGSAVPEPRAVVALEKIGRVLAARPGALVVRGHTDARPFRSETYDNWRLSTARAHMAYYMLMRGGIDERRFARIEGFADRQPRDASNPEAAINRRIDVLVRETAR